MVQCLKYIGENSLIYLCAQIPVIYIVLIALNKVTGQNWKFMQEGMPIYYSIIQSVGCIFLCTIIEWIKKSAVKNVRNEDK